MLTFLASTIKCYQLQCPHLRRTIPALMWLHRRPGEFWKRRSHLYEAIRLVSMEYALRNPNYERVPSPPRIQPGNVDVDDEENWPSWSGSHDAEDFLKKLGDNIESNNFSNIRQKDVPIAMNQIIKAVHRSPEELRIESLCLETCSFVFARTLT